MTLPNEILYEIFSYLVTLKDLQSISLVSHQWNAVSSDNNLWKSFCKYKYLCQHKMNQKQRIQNYKEHVKFITLYLRYDRMPVNLQILCFSKLEMATKYLLELSKEIKSSKKTINKLREYSEMEKIIIAIVEHGEDINQFNRAFDTPLHNVAASGSTTLVNYFLKCGAKIRVNITGYNPYHNAIQYGFEDIIDILLRFETSQYFAKSSSHNDTDNDDDDDDYYNNDIDNNDNEKENNQPNIPLRITECQLAIRLNQFSILKKLIRSKLPKFNVNSPTFQNYSLLHIASHLNKFEIAQFLLQNGSKVNEINQCSLGFTELHYAARNKNSAQILKLLIDYGANVNIRDSIGHTPLYYAIFSQDFNAVKLLIENGSENLIFYLHYFIDSVEDFHSVIEIILRSHPLLVNEIYDGQSLLHRAVKKKYHLMCWKLIEFGASIELKNVDGLSASDLDKNNVISLLSPIPRSNLKNYEKYHHNNYNNYNKYDNNNKYDNKKKYQNYSNNEQQKNSNYNKNYSNDRLQLRGKIRNNNTDKNNNYYEEKIKTQERKNNNPPKINRNNNVNNKNNTENRGILNRFSSLSYEKM